MPYPSNVHIQVFKVLMYVTNDDILKQMSHAFDLCEVQK